jgi:hypothetical protein
MFGMLRARKTPMCRHVLGSPADLWPTAFPGFRREARLTPGYARTAFQAEEKAATSRRTPKALSPPGKRSHALHPAYLF